MACKPPKDLTSAMLSAAAQDGTSNFAVTFTVRLTHPELLARPVEVQRRREQAASAPFQQQPHAHMPNEDRGAAAAGSVQGAAQEHHRGHAHQPEPEAEQGQGQERHEAAANPFHRYLEQLFPFPAGASTLPPDRLALSLPDELSPSEVQAHAAARLEMEAKRAVAQLLSDAPPPHQLLSSILGAQLRKLLGGHKCPGGGLRRLCTLAPQVFEVLPQVGGAPHARSVWRPHSSSPAWCSSGASVP